MREFALGAVIGGLVAGAFAWRTKVRYESQGAAFAATLARQGQQVQAALEAGGATVRRELEAVARASAQSIAIGRTVTILRAYGLDASTLSKLERLS